MKAEEVLKDNLKPIINNYMKTFVIKKEKKGWREFSKGAEERILIKNKIK